MKPITVNLATRPFRNNRSIATVLGGAAALLVLLSAYNVWVFVSYAGTYAQIQAQERADRGRLAALENAERGLGQEIAARDFRRIYERGRFANELILRRAFSWTLLFNTLESVIPAEVMMSAIRPSITGDGIQVRVEGLARSDDALYAFQGRLLGNPAFAKVTPISERRLNPGRPDITFALSFDYLPARASAPPPAVTASGPAPSGPATGPAGVPAASPPPAAVAAAPSAGQASPPAVAASGATEAGPVAAASPVRGTVGRDGRPRGGPAPARIVAAPGGVRLPSALAAAPPAGAPAGRISGGTRGRATPSPAPGADAGAGGPVPGPSPGRPGDAAPRRGAATGGAALAAERGDDPAAPAVRLDVPLRFAQRPVREVYDALARAHGVQFALDPAVDGGARVSADLAGRHLPEAIAVLGRAAGHRIVRLGDGRYRVALGSGGEPLADKPIREENPPPGETAP